MPQILDLGENGIHELPDDATPEEVQSFADGFNPKPPHDWRLDPQPSLTQSLAERMTPPALTKLPTKPQSPQFTPGVPTLSITPEQIAANDESSRQMLDEVSVARMAGIHPNRVMSGKEMSDASGVSPVITTPVSAVMKTGAGVANFLTSPRGVGESAVAATPAGPIVLTKWAYDMLKSGAESLVDIKDAIAQRLDEELAQSMTAGGGRQRDQSEFHQRLAEDAVNSAAGLYFGTKIGKGVATDAIVKTAPQLMPKTALAREIEKAPLTGKLQVDEAARLRSQLPPKAAPQEMLPEVARTQELVDQAIQEATQKIQTPGPSALELLRAQGNEIVPVEKQSVENRVRQPGESIVQPSLEGIKAKPGFERTADDLLQERDRTGALQPREQLTPEEIQALTDIVETETAIGKRFPVAPYLEPRTPRVGAGRSAKERAAIEKGMEQPSGNYLDEPTQRSLPEPEPPAPNPNQTILENPGTGRVIVKPTVLSKLQRERLIKAMERGADEQTIRNILRIKEPGSEKTAPKSPADLDTALQARGYGDIKRSKMTPEEKAAAAAEPIPTPEADAARFWEMNDAIKAEKDFNKKYELHRKFGDEMELIKNRNPKDSGNPPERPASEIVVETPPDLISKLNALKVKGPTGENLHNVFSAKAIAEIGKQLWNDSIDVAIAAIKAGRSAKAAIAEAISHIKRNARNYDEANLRAGLEQILKDEGLDARVSRTPAVAEGAGGTPEVVSETASKSIESPEGQKPRKFSARATTSERIPEQVQEQIRTDERSSYTPQKVADVRDEVKGMSDAELGALTTESASYTEGKAELMDRLFKAGNDQAGLDVFQNTAKELTRLGQLVNQAKLLNSIAPEAQILVINEGLKKAGKDPLTEAQRGKVLELGRQGRVAKGELDKATEAWQKDPTPENAKAADEALDKKNKIDLELQKFTNAFQPKTYASLLKAILQGNLLTPISQTANIVGNLSFLPFRAATRSVASGLDFLESAITGRPRTSTVGPISGTVEAAKGLARGAEKIPGILYRGTGNTILGEKRAGIQPIKAWMNQFAESPDMPTTGGKLTVNDRIKLLIEGTIGVPAEMMLRGLGAGDAPFKEAARGRVIANQLRLAKVPKAQWEMAQKFPELFFNKEKLDQIHKETLAAVFQRESKTLSLLTHWIAGKGELFDLAVATVAPYKVTPWNIIGEILSYNPVVAFSRGVYEAKQKNVRGINENAAKFLVGSALTAAGTLLYKNGLLSPSLDSKDETMKERILSQQVMPPNHLNISGTKRWLSGGDPKFQPGDQTVDVFRSGGLAGAFFYMTANIGRSLEKSPQGDTTDLLGAIGSQSTLEQARFGLNQSFLSGVEGLLTSVKDGNTDNYVKQWASTVTSIPLPNTLSTLSRATREFKPDFRADGFKGKIENIIRNRLGFAGLDDYLPLKRDFWGDPIPETPKDKSALFYQFFDVSKGQQITSDPKSIELYRLWRKTDDSKIIPTPVEKNQTFGDKTYILTPKQQEDLAIKVGKLRKEAVESLVTNPEWHKLADEQKVSILQRAYNKGLEFGKGKFYVENKDALEAKPKKAGFVLPQGK
jgi:hypothetical protein